MTEVWKVDLGSGYSGLALGEDEVIAFYSDHEHQVVASLDPATGAQRWRQPIDTMYRGHDGSHDGPIATPALADGRVFALSPHGQLVALHATTGERLWSVHLAKELAIEKPSFGFGASPVVVADQVVLGLGGASGAYAGFDPASGEILWQSGEDRVGYQGLLSWTSSGADLLIAPGNTQLYGLDPGTGKLRWQLPHGGSGGRGALSMTPVPVGPDLLFLAYKDEESMVLRLVEPPIGPPVLSEVVWRDRSLRNTYDVPVFHDRHLYGFSSRFLTCVEAETGRTVWRSRKPGDGFTTLVGDQLAILTKDGSVHLVDADPDGFHEVSSLQVFEDPAWTAPSVAGDSLFVRNLGQLARIRIGSDLERPDSPPTSAHATAEASPTAFDRFLARVRAEPSTSGKRTRVDEYLAAQSSFPIVEGEHLVHFVFRGEAEDVAIGGDLFGARWEEPMQRLEGTDLFYFSWKTESDARLSYLFFRDYRETLDPLNPRRSETSVIRKEMELSDGHEPLKVSWFTMPRWEAPKHLEPRDGPVGVLKRYSVEPDDGPSIPLRIYLPHAYQRSDSKRFPVLYMASGSRAIDQGGWIQSLNRLVGESVEPSIVVFADKNLFSRNALRDHIMPFVDSTFRTRPQADQRALVATGFKGPAALAWTLKNRHLIGKVGIHSAFMFTRHERFVDASLRHFEGAPLTVYLDWGSYDHRSSREAWDMVDVNRRLFSSLHQAGMTVYGGELHDGTGWPSWRTRTHRLLEALFPIEEPPQIGP